MNGVGVHQIKTFVNLKKHFNLYKILCIFKRDSYAYSICSEEFKRQIILTCTCKSFLNIICCFPFICVILCHHAMHLKFLSCFVGILYFIYKILMDRCNQCHRWYHYWPHLWAPCSPHHSRFYQPCCGGQVLWYEQSVPAGSIDR